MAVSLDEWIEQNGWKNFENEVKIHVETQTGANEETVGTVTRCIMISLRQEAEKRGKRPRFGG